MQTFFVRIFATLLVICAGVFSNTASAQQIDPSRVLIVYNQAAWSETGTGGIGASQWVAEYYRQKRNIPASNLCAVSIIQRSGYYNESITKSEYETLIRDQVKQCLNGKELSIDYIAVMYGVPLRVGSFPGDCATWPSYVREYVNNTCRKKNTVPNTVSVDNLLAALNSPASQLLISNPYSMKGRSTKLPRIQSFSNPSGWKPYLVYRLDGPTPALARSLVDRALAGEAPQAVSGSYGYFDCEGSIFPEICVAAQAAQNTFGAAQVRLNMNSVTRDMFAPSSSIVQSGATLQVVAQGRNTATLSFLFPQTKGALLRLKLASGYVINSDGSKWGYAPISVSLRSSDSKSGFDASFPLYLWRLGNATLSRIENGGTTNTASAQPPTRAVSELGLGTTTAGASILLNGSPVLNISNSAPENLSRASITFKNFRGSITKIEVLNAAGDLIFADDFSQPVGSRYQIETFGKEGPDAYFVAGSYSGGRYWNAFTFKPGAVGYQLTSYACNSLRRVTNYCPLYLQDGITATLGAVDEPFAVEMPKPDILHTYLYDHHYTFAEAAYAATWSLRWTTVIVGDGLYTPGLVKTLPPGPGGLPAPLGLRGIPRVAGNGVRYIEASWKTLPSQSGVTGYHVFLKPSSESQFKFNQTSSAASNDTDPDGSPRKTVLVRYRDAQTQAPISPGTYSMQVRAIKGATLGEMSSPVVVTVP